MDGYIMKEKKGLFLKAFIKELKKYYESCTIHLECEGLTFKMNIGELDKPIHEILLNKKIRQVVSENYTYTIWLDNNDSTNIDSMLVNKFFLTQYGNLCNRIIETLPKGYRLLYISPFVQVDEIGAYLEIYITDYSEDDKITKKYYLNI